MANLANIAQLVLAGGGDARPGSRINWVWHERGGGMEEALLRIHLKISGAIAEAR